MGEFGIGEALAFFESTLEEGLPPRVYDLDPEAAAPVQIWTDAMWEPSQEEPARVAFVVRFPAEARGFRGVEMGIKGVQYPREPDAKVVRLEGENSGFAV